MKGKTIHLLCVGKVKTGCWAEACAHYLAQARRWRNVEIIEVRDGDAALAPEARIAREGERILARLEPKWSAIALSEKGNMPDSPQFAEFIRGFDARERGEPVFVIGGPFGLSPAVLARCGHRLSLSAMTWPHELARALLLEQIFRGLCILAKFPYHH